MVSFGELSAWVEVMFSRAVMVTEEGLVVAKMDWLAFVDDWEVALSPDNVGLDGEVEKALAVIAAAAVVVATLGAETEVEGEVSFWVELFEANSSEGVAEGGVPCEGVVWFNVDWVVCGGDVEKGPVVFVALVPVLGASLEKLEAAVDIDGRWVTEFPLLVSSGVCTVVALGAAERKKKRKKSQLSTVVFLPS